MISVGLYPRVSTAEQAKDGYSIGEQIERMTTYCKAMDWTIYDTYTDAGFSGGSMDRPGLQRLIQDVESGKLNKVLVYKLDRLSRSQLDTLYLIEKVFLSNGVDFVSMTENFSADTPFGRAALGILSTFAQFEREQIKERMMLGKQARAKEGKFSGGNNIPYGYDYINGELVINPHESDIVKMVFRLYIGGLSPTTIARHLNASGLKSRKGAFYETTVRNILDNKNLIGLVHFQGNWNQGTHEPILTQDVFETAQDIRKRRRKKALSLNANIGKAGAYLTGLLFCSQCGGHYVKKTTVSKSDTTEYKYSKYGCANRIRDKARRKCNCKNKIWNMDDLDAIIFDEIRKLKLEPLEADSAPTPDVYKNELDDIDKRITRLMDIYESGIVSADELSERINTLNERKKALKSEISAVKDHSKIINAVNSFDDVIEHGTFEQIRVILSEIIRRIEIDGEDVKIFWNI